MTGSIILDTEGDREPDFWVMDMVPNGTFVKIAEVINREDGERVRLELTLNNVHLKIYLNAVRLKITLTENTVTMP